jgi:two-component system NtrC family response regulator
MADILIIDDDEMISEILHDTISQLGHTVSCSFTLNDGLKKALSKDYDVVFLDVRLPDGNGLDVLRKIHEVPASPEIIIITGFGDSDGAELAIRNGAWDYIEKGSSTEIMTLTFIRALEYREEKKKIKKPVMALKREGIIGKSPRIKACLDLLAQAAASEANVLITGETGTGKELFAWAIHQNSLRANNNFVVVDCAAIPENLVESILFGYEKGVFTGADKPREGLIAQAHGGTLFLDEVGELPQSLQKSFLRVLQEHRFRSIGGRYEIESDFRLIAATNRNITEMVKAGQFRNDLLFRLSTFAIELPPLRKNLEDIRELVVNYISTLCKRYGIATKGFSDDFIDVISSHDWPGNVRELINALEKAIAVAQSEPTLFPKHLPMYIRVKYARDSVSRDIPEKHATKEDYAKKDGFPVLRDFRDAAMADIEKRYLEDLVSFSSGNISDACRISGLSRSRLYALLKKYSINILRQG